MLQSGPFIWLTFHLTNITGGVLLRQLPLQATNEISRKENIILYLVDNSRSWLENIFYCLGLYACNDPGSCCSPNRCRVVVRMDSRLKAVPSLLHLCLTWVDFRANHTLPVRDAPSLPLESIGVALVVNKFWMAPLAGIWYYFVCCCILMVCMFVYGRIIK